MLSIRNLSKDFFGVPALENVNIDIQKGEIHCIVGHNGAGKSTLLKILSGFWKPTSGKILIDDNEVKIKNPIESLKQGIILIPQEPIVVESKTVAENIFLTKLPTKMGILDKNKLYSLSSEVLRKLNSPEISPYQLAGTLSLAQKEIIAIARALVLEPKIILFDEPTAFFSYHEAKKLFATIKELKKHGQTVIFVGHRLKEIFEIADQITVLRNGKCIGTFKKDQLTLPELAEMISGNKVHKLTQNGRSTTISGNNYTAPLLEVKNLTFTKGNRINNVSFKLGSGEILGIGGLLGAGKTEILKCISGILRRDSGEIFIKGQRVRLESFQSAWDLGIRYVPEDRIRDGLCLDLSVKDNITLTSLKEILRHPFFKIISKRKQEDLSKYYIRAFDIKGEPLQRVKGLSGGNQQKVLLANKINSEPQILLIDEPTRGVDVGAKYKIYELIRNLPQEKRGIGIIVASCELADLMEIADRVLIIDKGKVAKEILQLESLRESELFNLA